MFNSLVIEKFTERTGLCVGGLIGARQVVSLRDLAEVSDLMVMNKKYLEALLCSVRTSSGLAPYRGCRTVSVTQIDPSTLLIGQTFVERGKYTAMMESIGNKFTGFCFQGSLLQRPPLLVFGKDEEGTPSVAHYLPPIIENGRNLLDGVHRSYIAQAVSAPLTAIIVSGVDTPFPCELHEWDKVAVVEEKPAVEDRFQNLDPGLFRQLKDIGIDG
ncbi:MAG: hypothetical protein M1153_02840 [Patescibacteria group bacterium]|nr:hypothetical protein [Patescibacteria group bacterium]